MNLPSELCDDLLQLLDTIISALQVLLYLLKFILTNLFILDDPPKFKFEFSKDSLFIFVQLVVFAL
jgi:hypothetical protein